MKKAVLLLTLLVLGTLSCRKSNEEGNPYREYEKVSFEESDAVIPNPERGFYSTIAIHNASSPVSLNETRLQIARKNGRTLFLLEYYLTDYMDSDISDEYLALVRNNFEVFRNGGAKCIVRFAYRNDYSEWNHPWDATQEWALRHIEQLKPLLREYSDVIFVVQAGFVGVWGEWYYTDNFVMNPSSEEDYAPRKRLLEALLDALPESRQVEVRTPTFKMKMFGYTLSDTLTRAEAHSGSVKSRIAGHNDCYLASETDSGTYLSKDERAYWNAETMYTIMGGETCGLSAYCHCEGTGSIPGTVKDMENNHFSYLHLGYHPDVLARWREEGCFDEIERRLGYRLVLRDCYFSKEAKAGEPYRIVLNIENVGFASPMNPRDAEFVLTDTSGKTVATYPVDGDPRFWMGGSITTLDQSITLPSSASGELTLSLNLPDPEKTLRDKPLYSIQLANKAVWDESNGYNVLRTIKIKS